MSLQEQKDQPVWRVVVDAVAWVSLATAACIGVSWLVVQACWFVFPETKPWP